jgi:hypothetical protein
MKMHARMVLGGAVALAVGIWFISSDTSSAADDEKVDATKEAVQKLADAIAKGDSDAIQKQAKAIAEGTDLEEVMNLMRKRTAGARRKPFGVGTEGTMNPDGIEAKIQNMAKKAPSAKQLEKESAALVEMAYRVAAVAEVAKNKFGDKVKTAKDKKDWLGWADDMRKAADEFAEAAKGKKDKAMKTVAKKLDSSCSNCHGKFKLEE